MEVDEGPKSGTLLKPLNDIATLFVMWNRHGALYLEVPETLEAAPPTSKLTAGRASSASGRSEPCARLLAPFFAAARAARTQ